MAHNMIEEWSLEKIGCLQPDALVVDPVQKEKRILEYTRPNDTQPGAVQLAAAWKSATGKYQVIVKSLQSYAWSGWTVQLVPLPVGV